MIASSIKIIKKKENGKMKIKKICKQHREVVFLSAFVRLADQKILETKFTQIKLI
jgi:hypothetical protein